jgi:hypothetical protein
MGHSTSKPYSKWSDSGRVLFFQHRWSNLDRFSLALERMWEEQERIRAADMMANRFVTEYWPQIEVAVLPPIDGFSTWDVIRHRSKQRDKWVSLLQEFWRERV